MGDFQEKINNRMTIKDIQNAKTTLGAILVRYGKDPAETVRTSGLIIPQQQDLFIVIAEVVAVSDGIVSNGTALPSPVMPKDRILVEKRSGVFLGEQEDGHFYKVMMPKDILLVFPNEEKKEETENK